MTRWWNKQGQDKDAPPVRSHGVRRLPNGETLEVVQEVSFEPEEHVLTFEQRRQRREDNQAMKISRQIHRRRKKHGRQ